MIPMSAQFFSPSHAISLALHTARCGSRRKTNCAADISVRLTMVKIAREEKRTGEEWSTPVYIKLARSVAIAGYKSDFFRTVSGISFPFRER
ncbi:hypothetical protein PUN28_006457 [Cardiocondyla obscurior]|uniref:Uncharacterized protein n=1 Tax=Cardiocondyla obscurior TaxID=286306 RepID=A0AAW2G8Q8_9HYME